MASLISLSIDLTKVTKSRLKEGKYLNTTISINDETKFGNNVSMYESQTKEERSSKTPRTYLANGRVVWTEGEIAVAEKEEEASKPATKEADPDLPF